MEIKRSITELFINFDVDFDGPATHIFLQTICITSKGDNDVRQSRLPIPLRSLLRRLRHPYRAHRDGSEKLKQRLVSLYKGGIAGKGALPNSENLSTEDIRCDGCLADCLFMHCQQCDIRNCTKEKGISGCHQCDDFPCAHIENFPMTVGRKVILRSVPYRREHGTAKWVEDEEARYQCPDCGNKVFRGAVRCNRCKAELDLD